MVVTRCARPRRACDHHVMWLARRVPFRMHVIGADGENMGVVVYLVLTVAVFVALGLAQKLVERL